MPDAKHPVWALLRMTVGMTGLLFFLWINASVFDATELKTFGSYLLWMFSGETAIQFFQKK